jgi:hypothetical protein
MTTKDRNAIKSLYYFHNYIPASIARLFGLSSVRIFQILSEDPNVSFNPDVECAICGLDDCQTIYIDGNDDNNRPQNMIMLCEADKRRLRALQLRRQHGVIKLQL